MLASKVWKSGLLDRAEVTINLADECEALTRRYLGLAEVRAEVEAMIRRGEDGPVPALWAGLEEVVAQTQPRVDALIRYAEHVDAQVREQTALETVVRPAERLRGLLAETAGDVPTAAGVEGLTMGAQAAQEGTERTRDLIRGDLVVFSKPLEAA